eukprot:756140-Hanusia_phi.AAC.2
MEPTALLLASTSGEPYVGGGGGVGTGGSTAGVRDVASSAAVFEVTEGDRPRKGLVEALRQASRTVANGLQASLLCRAPSLTRHPGLDRQQGR